MKLKLEQILIDGGTQTRVTLNEDTIFDYAEAMTEGAKFPPVVVFASGTDYLLADGFHRFMAAQRNGWRDIDVEVRKGSRLDAIKYSLGANGLHGLPRSNADKRRCVEIALKEFGGMSDVAISKMCGVSDKTVAGARYITNRKPNIGISEVERRTGLDGKTRVMPRTAKDVFNEAEKETKKEERNDAKRILSPPCQGMNFAHLAIMKLEEIRLDDTEREQAFATVKEWIKNNES